MNNMLKTMSSKQYVLFAALVVIVAASSFYGGMQYRVQSNAGPENFRRLSGDRAFTVGGGPNANRPLGANTVLGEIIAKDEQSITVKVPDGGSKIIFFSKTTNVGKINSGTASDLVLGEQVTVNGLPNDDGSVTAQMIQIRPRTVQMNDGALIPQP